MGAPSAGACQAKEGVGDALIERKLSSAMKPQCRTDEVFGRSHVVPRCVCRLRGGVLTGLAGQLLRHGLWASFSPESAASLRH